MENIDFKFYFILGFKIKRFYQIGNLRLILNHKQKRSGLYTVRSCVDTR